MSLSAPGSSRKRRLGDNILNKENLPSTAVPSLHPPEQCRRAFKPPLPSRQDAAGRNITLGVPIHRCAQLGAPGLINALTKQIFIPPIVHTNQPTADDDNVDNNLENAPEIVLFDPEVDDLPPSYALPSQEEGAAAAAEAGTDDATGNANVNAANPYTKVTVDKFLSAKLRPHQVHGLQFMFRCMAGLVDPAFTGCIQSDSMGLGKSLQCIASMWQLLTSGIHGQPTCSRVLILVPSSLVANWLAECKKWLGDRLSPIAVEDTQGAAVKKTLGLIPNKRIYVPSAAGGGTINNNRNNSNNNSSRYENPVVVISSYSTFRLHLQLFYSKNFEMVICDEAHQLKNSDSQINKAVANLPCKIRLLASGTPIQNDLGEFFAMFNTACPGLLGTNNDFRKNYEIPILKGRDAGATDKELQKGFERSEKLIELCSRFMLRRTNSVLKKYLPAKIQQVIFCRMAPLQHQLYDAFLNSAPILAALSGVRMQDNNQALSTLPAITALKKLCCHPDLVYTLCAGNSSGLGHGHGYLSSTGGGLGGVGSTVVRRSASAVMTRNPPTTTTTTTNLNRSNSTSAMMMVMPTDKKPIITGFEGLLLLFQRQSVYPIYRPFSVQTMHGGKIMVLEALLKAIKSSAPTDKVVLVSNYTEALDLVQKLCTTNHWSTLRLDGSKAVKARQPLVDTFNDPAHPSYVLLLSSKAGGVGLNIIGANRLVLFDLDWNPANDQQAMARVWREGQAKTCYIYRLICTGSIEEKIFQRQLAKEGLSRNIVDEQADEHRTFSKDELRALFKVDTNTECDTHAAIKCPCDGSAEENNDDKDDEDGAGSNSSPGENRAVGGGSADSILNWCHSKDVLKFPDPAWAAMSDFIRSKFITFAFSDHICASAPEKEEVNVKDGNKKKQKLHREEEAMGQDASEGKDDEDEEKEGNGDGDGGDDESSKEETKLEEEDDDSDSKEGSEEESWDWGHGDGGMDNDLI